MITTPSKSRAYNAEQQRLWRKRHPDHKEKHKAYMREYRAKQRDVISDFRSAIDKAAQIHSTDA